MINRIFFIADTAFPSGLTDPDKDSIFYSFLVNPSKTSELDLAFKLLNDNSEKTASLTLNLQDELSGESIRLLCSFVFINSYSRVGNKPVFNILGKTPSLTEPAIERLTEYLKLQGIDNLLINDLNSVKDYHTANDGQKIAEMYADILEKGEFGKTLFFSISSSKVLTRELIDNLKRVEEEFKKRSPQLYSVNYLNSQLQGENDYLKIENNNLKSELLNQRQYADILRSHHSSKELQEYYNNEYEILPTWYKRVGHLIKVLKGKRTLKSLFRKDVKRYKD